MVEEFNFDDDTWDAICLARLRYVTTPNKRDWYHALRLYCGYTGGNYAMMHTVGSAADAWLQAHPTWVQRRHDTKEI